MSEELIAGHGDSCNCNLCTAEYDKKYYQTYTAYLRADIKAPTEEAARYKIKHRYEDAELIGIHRVV